MKQAERKRIYLYALQIYLRIAKVRIEIRLIEKPP